MTNHPSPTTTRSSKLRSTKTRWQGSSWRARNTCSGKESLATRGNGPRHRCVRCKEARPNGARQVQVFWWKVGQIQERSKEARPHPQTRQTHGRCIQGVKVECYNTMRWIVATLWSWKESLEDHLKSCTVQPFPLESTSTVLESEWLSYSQKDVDPLDELRPCRIQKYHHRMPTMVVRVKRRIHVTDERKRTE